MTLLTPALPTETTRPRPANEREALVAREPDAVWQSVCALDDIDPNTGVCALVGADQVLSLIHI